MSKYHEPMLLHPSRLFSSVGTCGTNASEDVKNIQKILVDIFFQGVENAEALFRAAIKGKSALIELVRASSIYMSYESNRKRLRYLK
ncbi:hypothetical protein [Kosakonia oryziphila]|uniref:Uncharacterized protein n=1 Tax=Kosakonia oryziphila TaxID=1005667 RepID=A0A1C4D299_9ENTR|nr:hypothetical protein [Kosakonia oryziphila]SCC25502.1 hypothetical protein GA0061070_101445 [Kosakonia oryziphila]